jgi:hypothetical protein
MGIGNASPSPSPCTCRDKFSPFISPWRKFLPHLHPLTEEFPARNRIPIAISNPNLHALLLSYRVYALNLAEDIYLHATNPHVFMPKPNKHCFAYPRLQLPYPCIQPNTWFIFRPYIYKSISIYTNILRT